MAAEWLTCPIIIAVASPTFGHFETVRPVWIRVARWLVYLAVTAAIGATAGRPYTSSGFSAYPPWSPSSTSPGVCATASTPSPPNPETATNNSADVTDPVGLTAIPSAFVHTPWSAPGVPGKGGGPYG